MQVIQVIPPNLKLCTEILENYNQVSVTNTSTVETWVLLTHRNQKTHLRHWTRSLVASGLSGTMP